MYLQYGSTTLRVIDLNRFERVNVYDESGTDLLYVKVLLGVSAVYSPGGIPRLPSVIEVSQDVSFTYEGIDETAATLQGTPRGLDPETPDYTSGPIFPINPTPQLETDIPQSAGYLPTTAFNTGAQTDAELRWRLLSPRQQLILWAYDRQTGNPIQWLCSPRQGFTVDAKNGPKPISCDVISAQGEPNAVGMFYQILTHVTPCPQGSDRLVLSHRWTMTHTHDDRYFLTRITSGTIVFNSAVTDLLDINPDWVRNQFIHPIPLGYQRSVPAVTMRADGLTIDYVIRDTDPTIVFEPGDSGAAAIQINEKVECSQGTAANILDKLTERKRREWHFGDPISPGGHRYGF